jgi:hypothetical protein
MLTYSQTQVIYQAEPHCTEILKNMKDSLHSLGKQYLGHGVRIETIDGHLLEGTIVYIDSRNLHLHVHNHDPHRGFYNPAAATILPLVLYELLVITLLS